jgi:hypothetical protein
MSFVQMSAVTDTDKLVLDYLLANGYAKAAEELQKAKDSITSSSSTNLSSRSLITSTKSSCNKDNNQQAAISSQSMPSASHDSAARSNGGRLDENTNQSANATHFNQDVVIFGIHQGNSISYIDAYKPFRLWVHESLDLCKDELIHLSFPVFVHW